VQLEKCIHLNKYGKNMGRKYEKAKTVIAFALLSSSRISSSSVQNNTYDTGLTV
jgi:hypothetical protein